MKRTLFLVISGVILITLTWYIFSPVRSAKMSDEIKVAFIADQGLTPESKRVLELIKAEQADLLVVQGDFDYHDNPQAWDAEFNSVLGPAFPILSTVGNHDVRVWSQYQKKIAERINLAADLRCSGNIGEQSVCTYKNITLVSVAPGIFKGNYPAYISSSLSHKNNSWKICLWHENQQLMQVGEKQNETGWDVYDACRQAGAFIVNGHEHSYERTYLLDNFKTPHIVSTSTVLALKPGQTFVVVSGLGGESERAQVRHDLWWASIYTTSQNAKPGALFCAFNTTGSTTAQCYFKDIAGKIADHFIVTR